MTAKNIKIWMNLCSVDYFPNYLFVSFFLRSSSQRTVCDVVLIKTKKKNKSQFCESSPCTNFSFFWSESHVCVCVWIYFCGCCCCLRWFHTFYSHQPNNGYLKKTKCIASLVHWPLRKSKDRDSDRMRSQTLESEL